MGIFSFLKKKKRQRQEGKIFLVTCDILFGKIVVAKQKFTVRAPSKYAAKKELIETVKILPKTAKKLS